MWDNFLNFTCHLPSKKPSEVSWWDPLNSCAVSHQIKHWNHVFPSWMGNWRVLVTKISDGKKIKKQTNKQKNPLENRERVKWEGDIKPGQITLNKSYTPAYVTEDLKNKKNTGPPLWYSQVEQAHIIRLDKLGF